MKLKELFEETIRSMIIDNSSLNQDGYLKIDRSEDTILNGVLISHLCKIKSLKGIPKIINGELVIDYLNELETLQDGPNEIRNVFMYGCP